MTIDVADRVRRAIDDIIDPAAELGRCPTPGTAEIAVQTKVSVDSSSGWLQLVGRSRTLPARRFAVVAAGLLLVVGSLAIVLRAQQRDTATTAASGLIDLGSVERYPIGSVTFVDEPPLFVVNDASTGIVVLDARSTHLGCVVVVDDPETAAELGAGIDEFDVREFIDPCHGSEYGRAGDKVGGPAPRGLDRYPFEIVDQRLVVDLTKPILGLSANPPDVSAADLDLSHSNGSISMP
jgi:hypothetical protein